MCYTGRSEQRMEIRKAMKGRWLHWLHNTQAVRIMPIALYGFSVLRPDSAILGGQYTDCLASNLWVSISTALRLIGNKQKVEKPNLINGRRVCVSNDGLKVAKDVTFSKNWSVCCI